MEEEVKKATLLVFLLRVHIFDRKSYWRAQVILPSVPVLAPVFSFLTLVCMCIWTPESATWHLLHANVQLVSCCMLRARHGTGTLPEVRLQ